jgi:hypothetical protein
MTLRKPETNVFIDLKLIAQIYRITFQNRKLMPPSFFSDYEEWEFPTLVWHVAIQTKSGSVVWHYDVPSATEVASLISLHYKSGIFQFKRVNSGGAA